MKRAAPVLALAMLAASQACLAATPAISAGNQFTLALKADGTTYAWGRNDYGQLGNGQSAMRTLPAKIGGIDRVSAAAVGDGWTLALREDGTVWGWGSNGAGQLGDATLQGKSHPVQASGLAVAIASIASGAKHALALGTDGSVWAWGWGQYGQTGNGSNADRSTAAKVAGLPQAMSAIAAGVRHSLALASDGTVWAWGDNSAGQLGDGSTVSRATPARIAALSNITAVSTTAWSNLALDSAGRVWAWGYGGWGALGDGGHSDRSTPFVVAGLPRIVAITAGNRLSIAIAADASVWVWGNNGYGQFGAAGTLDQPTPVSVTALNGLSDFSIGEFSVIALQADGSLRAWGGNSYGQLGLGDSSDRTVPDAPITGTRFQRVAAGPSHTVAVAADASIWGWGSNGDGELADGTANVRNFPVAVQGMGSAIAIAAGYNHALALDSDGSVWAWGDNTSGALGNGGRYDSATPLRIGSVPSMSAVAAGNGFSLALEANGTVWSWGNASDGQLGNGNALVAQLTPAALTSISGIAQISTRYNHVLALGKDGAVRAWGANGQGQLGDGSSTSRSAPVRVSGLASEMVAVAAGGLHSLALDRSGSVWAWGQNADGQLGDGSTSDRNVPARVVGLSDAIAIAAGEKSSYALTRDGRIWAWGRNAEGELGTGSIAVVSAYARTIDGLGGFQAVSGGSGSAAALRSDGTVWAWGRNFEGQLGDATFAQRNAPVLTVNTSADAALDLDPTLAKTLPADRVPPFFATALRAGDLSRLTVSATAKFNAADLGKQGAIYITAAVPQGTLAPAQSPLTRAGASLTARAGNSASAYDLVQLTAAGWQNVVGGQFLPYASGVLGDQLAAQKILSDADASQLAGAQFCIGYGDSADAMIAAGTMRVVASIPDPNATSTGRTSCIAGAPLNYALALMPGWNLLGNGLNQTLSVAALHGSANAVTSVWKWDALQAGWQFYAPSLDAAALQAYASGKGYGVLSEIKPGEGYWVNAIAQPTPEAQSGMAFTLKAAHLLPGWNLVATGNAVTPAAFNSGLSATALTTLWAWDNAASNWYFYAPGLDAQGGTALSGYIASKGYLDFGANSKTLGNSTGFWVNKP